MTDRKDIAEELEAMIDQHGLLHVLTGLELICYEKAEHLRSNWQDKVSAKVWDQDGKAISQILPKINS